MERWRRIDEAPPEEAREQLRICCAVPRWIERMIERRPFGSAEAMRSVARHEWFALSPEEWREAFAHHPRIGDLDGMRRRFSSTRELSEREQSGVCSADVRVLRALLEANREYEDRFGWIFIVCAAGKSADEMLGLLRERLRNAPHDEMRIAAEEHAKICELRLTSPVAPPSG